MATFYIKHITKYSYTDKVIDGATLTRLHPINDAFQKVSSHLLSVTNNPYIETFFDFFNNRIGTFMVTEPHNELSIISEIEVETYGKLFPEDTASVESQWEELKSIKNHILYIDFLRHRPFEGSKGVLELIEFKKLKSKSPFKAVLELCEFVFKNFKYESGITNVNTDLDTVWKLKGGVCQDFTNILLQMVRMMGIPARYVSGYICPSDEITRGEGATHAWIEAYIPFYGWLGIDPTNNAIADENHVRLAIGRNYNDCSPVKGVFKGNVESKMEVSVEVQTEKSNNSNPASFVTAVTENNNSFQRNLERNIELKEQSGQQQQQ